MLVIFKVMNKFPIGTRNAFVFVVPRIFLLEIKQDHEFLYSCSVPSRDSCSRKYLGLMAQPASSGTH